MQSLARFWWTFEAEVKRRDYFIHGVCLTLVKFVGDVALVGFASGRTWHFADYVQPLRTLTMTVRADTIAPRWLLPAMAFWMLPFLWAGLSLTVRRLRDAGLPLFVVMFFFVPYINYVGMLVLASMPTADPPSPQRLGRAGMVELDTDRWTAAGLGIVCGLAIGLLLMWLSVTGFRQYSAGLFVGAPVLMCAVTSFVFVRRCPGASRAHTNLAAMVMLMCVAGVALLAAFEGIVCIAMAAPLAAGAGWLGAELGAFIARAGQDRTATTIMGSVALPLMMWLTPGGTSGAVTHQVLSVVEIDAPPEQVWPRVIAFSPMAPPTDLIFRLGVAYPMRARIDGAGVGAVRYCEFSTGAFVEPITAWEENRRLAFDVRQSPPVMRELSVYANVSAPHLQGFLNSRRGEFRLVPLAGGRTRLEGRTWYELDMAPEGYWQLIGDALIHRIHERVLAHIKAESESSR